MSLDLDFNFDTLKSVRDDPVGAYDLLISAELALSRMEKALIRIQQWSEAYPLEIFPEPDDWPKIGDKLKVLGSPNRLDNVSASCMRRVVEGVADLAKQGLTEGEG